MPAAKQIAPRAGIVSSTLENVGGGNAPRCCDGVGEVEDNVRCPHIASLNTQWPAVAIWRGPTSTPEQNAVVGCPANGYGCCELQSTMEDMFDIPAVVML